MVPMAWSEAYTAMQQGAIDGQENPATVIDKNNVVEVNKHMAITEHVYSTVYVLMAPKTWNSLTDEDQQVIAEVWRKPTLRSGTSPEDGCGGCFHTGGTGNEGDLSG